MSEAMWFTRARLSRTASLSALLPVLSPGSEDARVSVGHRLLWTLFADHSSRRRDFLWREAEPGVYYILSERQPRDENNLFELGPAKPFEPQFSVGDQLSFVLRANATVARRISGKRGPRSDVVMHAIHSVARDKRADARRDAVQAAGVNWLQAQGGRHGFELLANPEDGAAAQVRNYRPLRISHGGPPAVIGVLDFEGELNVTDPENFTMALKSGFGRAKAFGCGLMLVRRR